MADGSPTSTPLKLDQDILKVMHYLWMKPLISTAQLEVDTGFTNNRVHRLLTRLERHGLAIRYALAGSRRKKDRWWLKYSGVLTFAHEEGFPIPWQVSEEGITTHISRMAVVEHLYDLALVVRAHPGVQTDRPVRMVPDLSMDPVQLKNDAELREFIWYADAAVDAVLHYADGPWFVLLWLGPETTYHEMRRRFQLVRDVPGATRHIGLDRRLTPTGWVMVCADRLVAAQAAELWPGDDALVVTADGHVERTMRPVDFSLRVRQEVESHKLGRPEQARRWAQKSPTIQGLNHGFRYQVFRFISQLRAATPAQLNRKFGEAYGGAVRVLLKRGLIVKLDGGFYPTRRGINALVDIDGVDHDIVSGRLSSFLTRDSEYRQLQQRHDRALVDVTLKFESEGVEVFAGFRHLVHYEGTTQVAPDAVICLTRKGGRTLLVNVELEFTAIYRKRRQKKLRPYLGVDLVTDEPGVSLWIFEHRWVADLYAKEGEFILMMTSTFDEFLAGTSFGPHSAWRMYGDRQPIDDLPRIMDIELHED